MCIGSNSFTNERGEVTDVKMSTGTRKELIYKIKYNWFFADELKPWYDGMIKQIIGEDVDYAPNKVLKFNHQGITYTITAIKYNSYIGCCYVKVDKVEGTARINDKERGIGFYALRPKQIERIYKKLFN